MAKIDPDLLNPKRPTNWDFVGRAGPVDEMVKKVIEFVNKQIAPAVIDEHFYRAEDQQALQFHARWGTFRVRFRIGSHLLDRAYQGPEWLAHEMEHLVGDAIQNAITDLVKNTMQAVVAEGVERELRRFNLDLQKEKERLLADIDRRLIPKPSWYRRAWEWVRRDLGLVRAS